MVVEDVRLLIVQVNLSVRREIKEIARSNSLI